MHVDLSTKNLEITEDVRKLVDETLISKVDELIEDVPEDQKVATVRIEKRPRWGYKVSFNMRLPRKKHIFAVEKDDRLQTTIVNLREQVMQQIKKLKAGWRNY